MHVSTSARGCNAGVRWGRMAPAQAIPVGTGLSQTQGLAGGEPSEEQGNTSFAGLPVWASGHGIVLVTAGGISLVGVTGRAGNGGEGNCGESVETLTRDVW